jgi:hypothetical protein
MILSFLSYTHGGYSSESTALNAPLPSSNDEPQTTLVAASDEDPHTTLKALVPLLPQTTELPHTMELPATFVPQTTDEPQTTDVPQTTDEDAMELFPFAMVTTPVEAL